MDKKRLSIEKIKKQEHEGDLLTNKIGIMSGLVSTIGGFYVSYHSIEDRDYVRVIIYLLIGVLGTILTTYNIDKLIKKRIDEKSDDLSNEINMLRNETNVAIKKLEDSNALAIDKYYELSNSIDKKR